MADQENDEVVKVREEIEKFNQEFPDHKLDNLPEGATAEQIKAVRDQMEAVRKGGKTSENSSDGKSEDGKSEDGKSPAKDSMKVEDKEKAETNRESLSVSNDNNGQEPDWIKEKREFWQKYAQDNKYSMGNDIAKDTQEKSFTGTLSKDGQKLGEIKYTSQTAVTISKDSSIELYQGLVKDAMSNELSVTFGDSLDDKQKAMLFAACLMNKDKYKDGTELAMVNPPKIDMNAEYFKELPDNVKTVLTEHIKETEIQTKLGDIRARLKNTNKKGKMTEEEKTARVQLRQEQLAAMKEQAQLTPDKIVGKDQEDVEKIMAARMGIAPHTTKTGVKVKSNETYAQRKDQQNPALRAFLTNKYGKSNS